MINPILHTCRMFHDVYIIYYVTCQCSMQYYVSCVNCLLHGTCHITGHQGPVTRSGASRSTLHDFTPDLKCHITGHMPHHVQGHMSRAMSYTNGMGHVIWHNALCHVICHCQGAHATCAPRAENPPSFPTVKRFQPTSHTHYDL